jgi:hypothetical protein
MRWRMTVRSSTSTSCPPVPPSPYIDLGPIAGLLGSGVHSARVTAYDLEAGTRATKGWTFRVAQRE